MENGRSSISIWAISLLCFVIFVSCSRQPKLTGKWKWISTDCARGFTFPENLEFLDDGTYVGALPFLSGGEYSMVDRGRIKLDTTAGPRIYEYSIEADLLTLRSDANCSYRYKRAE